MFSLTKFDLLIELLFFMVTPFKSFFNMFSEGVTIVILCWRKVVFYYHCAKWMFLHCRRKQNVLDDEAIEPLEADDYAGVSLGELEAIRDHLKSELQAAELALEVKNKKND